METGQKDKIMKKGRLSKEEIKFIRNSTMCDKGNELSAEKIAEELNRSVSSIEKQISKITTVTNEEKIDESKNEPKIVDSNTAQLEILTMIKDGKVSPEQGAELLKAITPSESTKKDDSLTQLPSFNEVWSDKEHDDYVENVKENEFFATDEHGEIMLDEGGYRIPTEKFLKFRKKRGPVRKTDRKGNCMHKSVKYDARRGMVCNTCGRETSSQYSEGKSRTELGAAVPHRGRGKR